ncbi:acyl-CoA thioesterase [bacterium]|nr:acyl-CoA thioesterase [bacterium]
MKHLYHMTIKEFHLDTFGHVNNAVYLQIFEEARWEVITENGYGLKKVIESKKGPVILDVKLEFLIELKLREKITIETSMEPFSGKVGAIHQQILNSENKIACKAHFHFGYFDLEKRKLIDPTDEWLRAIGLK